MNYIDILNNISEDEAKECLESLEADSYLASQEFQDSKMLSQM